MNTIKSQEIISQENLEGINFLYCEPFSEEYYTYSINSIENKHIIKRLDLNKLLSSLSTKYNIITDLTSHFRKFIYIKELNDFQELVPNDSKELENKEIQLIMEKEMKQEKIEINSFSNLKETIKNLQNKVFFKR